MFNQRNNNNSNDFYAEENFENNRIDQTTIANDEVNKNVVNYEEARTPKKKFAKGTIIIIAILVLLLIIALIVRNTLIGVGTLKSVTIDSPSVIYMGEKTNVTAKANGKGNLKQTTYQFGSTNSGIVELNTKGELKGKKVENILIPITTGKFGLTVDAELDGTKIEQTLKEVTICKKLTKEALSEDEIIGVTSKETKLIIDIGDDKECYGNLSYNVKDSTIAKVSADGVITGTSAGITTIAIEGNGISLTRNIKIVKDESSLTSATKVTLNKNVLTLELKETEKLEATVIPEDSDVKTIIWESNNNGIATVSSKGLVTGIGKGVAIITAYTSDKKHQAVAVVSVKAPSTSSGGSSSGGSSSGGSTVVVDKVAPTILSTEVISNYTDTAKATAGNTITIKLTFNKKLSVAPSVTFDGTVVSMSSSAADATNPVYIGTYNVTSDTTLGKPTIKITGYKNADGYVGEEKTLSSPITIIKLNSISCSITKTNTGSTSGVTLTIVGSGSSSLTYSFDGTTFNSNNTKTGIKNGTYTAYIKDVNGDKSSCSATVTSSTSTVNYCTKTTTTRSCSVSGSTLSSTGCTKGKDIASEASGATCTLTSSTGYTCKKSSTQTTTRRLNKNIYTGQITCDTYDKTLEGTQFQSYASTNTICSSYCGSGFEKYGTYGCSKDITTSTTSSTGNCYTSLGISNANKSTLVGGYGSLQFTCYYNYTTSTSTSTVVCSSCTSSSSTNPAISCSGVTSSSSTTTYN